MELRFCPVCGEQLKLKPEREERLVSFCERCGDYRFPLFSAAVSAVVLDPEEQRILLIRQYGEADPVLPAGYVDKGETAEQALRRELWEELGLRIRSLSYRGSRYYAPSETLMLHFAVVADGTDVRPNWEVDSWEWVEKEEARKRVRSCGLADQFLSDSGY